MKQFFCSWVIFLKILTQYFKRSSFIIDFTFRPDAFFSYKRKYRTPSLQGMGKQAQANHCRYIKPASAGLDTQIRKKDD